jgi:hypothetical protein
MAVVQQQAQSLLEVSSALRMTGRNVEATRLDIEEN